MTDICKLCLMEADLRKSHIVPEWCYRATYDDRHRAIVKRAEISSTHFIQKGWRQRLLCQKCEARFSRWESWFARFWKESPGLPESMSGRTTDQQIFVMDGVDYAPFKLFHLSILWRASVASGPDFDNVSLGPYEEKLRLMLVADNPGTEDVYPVYGMVLTHDDGSVVHEILSKPQRAKLERVTVYYSAYAGCEWTWIVADRSEKITGALRVAANALTVRRGGKLRLWVRNFQECNTIKLWQEQSRGT